MALLVLGRLELFALSGPRVVVVPQLQIALRSEPQFSEREKKSLKKTPFLPTNKIFIWSMRDERIRLAWVILCIGLGTGVAANFSACDSRREVWVYSSLSPEILEELVDPLQAAVPDADVRWYQSSSEGLATRLNSELQLGKMRADLVMLGDPSWFLEKKKEGLFQPVESDALRAIPEADRDRDQQFVTVKRTLAVIAYADSAHPTELPETWKDLIQPKFMAKLSLSIPFDSALSWFLFAQLSQAYGWEYVAELKKLRAVVEGSQNSVLGRIRSGERPLGVVPLEAIFRPTGKGIPIRWVQPKDGLVSVPTLMAVLKDAPHPEQAKKIMDWFISAQAQTLLATHGALPVLPKVAPPIGVRLELSSEKAVVQPIPMGPELPRLRDRTRAKFSEVFLH